MDDARGFSDADQRPSLPVLAVIVLLHIALLYALILAFAPNLVMEAPVASTATFNITVTKPEPEPSPNVSAVPEPAGAQGDPGERATPRAVSAPQSPIPMPSRSPAPRAASTGEANQSGAADAGTGTGAAGQGDGTGAGGDGQGSGGGAVTEPRLVTSISDVSLFEIPPEGRQTRVGTRTIVILEVSAQGRVTACRVSRSSGFPETDARVCELSYERIRFEPARDAAGNGVASRFFYQQRYFERGNG